MVVRGVQQVDESQAKETVLDHLVNAIRTADRCSRSRIAGVVQSYCDMEFENEGKKCSRDPGNDGSNDGPRRQSSDPSRD